ncbi:DUF5590 domain-containing protein [Fictibacillus phosphorivorans]|uniref:cell wall elongation regulator TseB-like domain-containing protein n=1 Tax=Fictibacillus phosphorivorans TaxID=1221500 RepID=UPI00203FE40B|nr:DUF5590 domain-containing protein [Fictibacillus phosphorivorans]MCM3718900.1 DUF5590 domain-containing protein [Fictibacillus phosphorivorans]MCM3776522.1 DUF5590 domain-containing protein [Fictibacillus phosphorivorans]
MGKKWILIIIGILILTSWQAYYLYNGVFAEQQKKEAAAIELAKKELNLKTVTNIDHFFKNETYYVVEGKNDQGTDMIAWVGSDKEIYSEKAKEGLSEKQMIDYVKKNQNAVKIIDSRLGMEDEIPLWEVVYIDDQDRYTYYYGYFETGKRYEIYRLKESEQ